MNFDINCPGPLQACFKTAGTDPCRAGFLTRGCSKLSCHPLVAASKSWRTRNPFERQKTGPRGDPTLLCRAGSQARLHRRCPGKGVPPPCPARSRHSGHVSARALPPLPLPSHQAQLLSLNGALGAGGASAARLPAPSPRSRRTASSVGLR